MDILTDGETPIIPVSRQSIRLASQMILDGQCIALPTETVYGLAADATNSMAVANIYAAKGRPSFNPLIILVPDLAAAEEIAEFTESARLLAEKYWPGPLTLVLPLLPSAPISSLVTAGLGTVALRCPAHPAMLAVLRASGRPIAAPSANASGTISPTRAEHVASTLRGRIPLIFDAGPCAVGLESTIVAVDPGGALRLLRAGPVDLGLGVQHSGTVEAPGQLASHYAPTKPLRLNVVSASIDEWLIGFGSVTGDETLSASGDLTEAAARLFDLLHRADRSVKSRIAVAPVEGEGLGIAIRDRLTRAAYPRI